MILAILAPVVSLSVTALLMPVTIRVANRFGWYDSSSDRKIHTGRIPRIGGIPIFVGFVLVVTGIRLVEGAVAPDLHLTLVFWAGLGLFFALGLADDFLDIHGLLKLFVQVVAAVLMVAGGAAVTELAAPALGIRWDLGMAGFIVSTAWIVLGANAVNLVDGMDGLAATVAGVATAAMGAVLLVVNSGQAAIIAFTLCGAIIGFLLFNFPPARIFMGDGGSLFLGAIIAALPLAAASSAAVDVAYPLLVALLLLTVPLADTFAAIIRRSAARQPFWRADRSHLHHVLLQRGYSDKVVLGVAVLLSAGGGVGAVLLQHAGAVLAVIIVVANVAAIAALFFWVHRPAVRSRREPKAAFLTDQQRN